MRTVTFSDAKVAAALSKDFACAWKNIRPGQKFKQGENGRLDDLLAKRPGGLPEGTGATNICAVFALPDGRIVHAVQGYSNPSTFAREIAFALEAAKAARGEKPEEALGSLYQKRLDSLPPDEKGSSTLIPLKVLAASPLPPVDKLLEASAAGLR
jgi:hypothetical protein